MAQISFHNEVAVITGSALGLGKTYSTLLTDRGASVVVNDIATDKHGDSLAEKTVSELKKRGGDAIADTHSVAVREGVDALIDQTMERYGKVDILVHNAGKMITKPLEMMSDLEWSSLMDVHLQGAFYLLRRVLPIMRKQEYGRIVLIASSTGMFGLQDHAGYAAAKSGVVGLGLSVAAELESSGICCNLVSPFASTVQTSNAVNPLMADQYDPEWVAPLVAYLCSGICKSNGNLYVAGGGYFARSGICEAEGISINRESLNIEEIADRFGTISDMSNSVYLPSITHAGRKLFKSLLRRER
ncbi:SDR family NAD(P)-dependent oxidoreductase [Paenibacillus sp. M1]|uniref:SDR family NAD(P)-dependent oxidoreductase n=1 Tax=Paenibacillus haidiansis TaxID=1574488 RepID=A0ABU7VQ98_9BACL